jgi:hypothetical protein
MIGGVVALHDDPSAGVSLAERPECIGLVRQLVEGDNRLIDLILDGLERLRDS